MTEHIRQTIGNIVGVMGVDAVAVGIHCIEEIDYELYKAHQANDQRGAIRTVDVDSGEVITIIRYPTFQQAETVYMDAIERARKIAAEPVTAPE